MRHAPRVTLTSLRDNIKVTLTETKQKQNRIRTSPQNTNSDKQPASKQSNSPNKV